MNEAGPPLRLGLNHQIGAIVHPVSPPCRVCLAAAHQPRVRHEPACYPANVACPYFHPEAPLENGLWLKPPRVPLGDPCQGFCEAVPGEMARPALDELRTLCNHGYARGKCARFPMAAEGDALRFSIISDKGGTLDLVFVVEQNYSPLRHRVIRFQDMRIEGLPPEDHAAAAQARLFIQSYLDRKPRA